MKKEAHCGCSRAHCPRVATVSVTLTSLSNETSSMNRIFYLSLWT